MGEYMKGKGGLEKSGSIIMENWRTFYHSHPHGNSSPEL